MNIWMIMIIVMALSFLVQQMLQSRFNKYSQVGIPSGMTGAQVAQKMLNDHGIYNVKVVPTKGMLTDHFNPQTMTVALSEGVYASRSVAAAAVAAHECGHAVQHARGYAALRMRSALVPVVNFASSIVQWVLLLGVLMINTFPGLLWFGIILFATTTLFSFITLPVEINASSRAMSHMESLGIIMEDEKRGARKVLSAAAMTYVASLAMAIMNLIRILALRNRD